MEEIAQAIEKVGIVIALVGLGLIMTLIGTVGRWK